MQTLLNTEIDNIIKGFVAGEMTSTAATSEVNYELEASSSVYAADHYDGGLCPECSAMIEDSTESGDTCVCGFEFSFDDDIEKPYEAWEPFENWPDEDFAGQMSSMHSSATSMVTAILALESVQQSVLDNTSTDMLIAELNKRGLKVKNNNDTSSGGTYLVTIDHVEGPCTQLCDTEANAKAFVFGHVIGYETFEEFDAALKASIDAIEGVINYSIVKQKAKDFIEVDNEYCTDVCPCCGSSNIEGGSVEVDADGAHQPITCHNCGAEYDDNYRLVGYEITSEGRNMNEDGPEPENEYYCTKCNRYFTEEDIEMFMPCVCKVCAQDDNQ